MYQDTGTHNWLEMPTAMMKLAEIGEIVRVGQGCGSSICPTHGVRLPRLSTSGGVPLACYLVGFGFHGTLPYGFGFALVGLKSGGVPI